MIPLRAAMPSTVTNPTSEPSDSTPPPRIAPTTPPIRANGSVRATSAVSRSERKSAWMISRMPSSDSAARASSRRLRLLAGGVFAEELGVVLAREVQRLDLLLDLAGDAAQVAPRATLQVTSIRREAPSRLISLGAGTSAISATSPSGTCVPSGVSIGRVLSFETSLRTSSTPQTNTSKIFCSWYSSPTFVPLTSVVAARRTSPAVRPSRAAASGRSRTSSCGTRICGSTFRFVDPRRSRSIALSTSCALARSTAMSGPKIRTTTVAPAPVSTSLIRSFR